MKTNIKALGLALSLTSIFALSSCGRATYPIAPTQNPYQAFNNPYAMQNRGYQPQMPQQNTYQPVAPQAYGYNTYNSPVGVQSFGMRAAGDLVEAPGFVSGDSIRVKGPLWFKGSGTLHQINPNAFDLEFTISSYHLRVSATRINETQAKFVTIDYKSNRTEEAIASYHRSGNTTVFDIGKGQKVEKLTVTGKSNGYMEAVVVQPSAAMSALFQGRGSTTLKFYKN